MANLKDVIYLSNEDYDTLVSTGTVTIDGDVLTYDESNVYITPEVTASSSQDGLMSAADKVKLDGIEAEMANYLPLTGGTLSLANSDSLKVKRTASASGAFISYFNNNQDTNRWYAGMRSDGAFCFNYNGTDKVTISDGGNIYENGTALINKYLPKTGGTLILPDADSFKIKRTVAGSGAFINFFNNNQDTNYWKVGMDSGNAFRFDYNGATKAQVDTAGNLYEGGTTLSSKYVQLANLNSAIDSRLTSKYQIEENNGALQLSTSKTVNVEGDTVSITSDGSNGISLYDANSFNALDINSNGIDLIADYKFDVSAAGGSVYVRTIDGTNLDISAIGTVSLTGAVAIGGTGQDNSALYYDAGYLGLCNDKIHLDYATGNYYTDSAINIAIPNLYKMFNQNTMQYSNPYISTDDQATAAEMAEILAVLS